MKQYLDYVVEQITDLCRIPSPSGFTSNAIKHLDKRFKEIGFNVEYTRKKAAIVNLGGEGSPLVLAAHIDTLGAMVRSVKTNGRLRITKIGGYPENNIESENCIVHTRDGKTYTGTIQMNNPAVHVNAEIGKQKRDDTTVEMVIDEKVNSAEDTKKLGICAGDFISFDPRTVVTDSGYIKSRHLDDKASAGILMGIAKMVTAGDLKLNRKVYLLFTNYEEVGHGGSSGIPEDVEDMISVDMGAVGDDLETDETKVSICAKDSGGPYDFDVTNQLVQLSKENKLSYAVDIYPYYGSDVEATLRAGYDIRHGLIGPGVAASHGYERTHKDGLENTMKLLKLLLTV